MRCRATSFPGAFQAISAHVYSRRSTPGGVLHDESTIGRISQAAERSLGRISGAQLRGKDVLQEYSASLSICNASDDLGSCLSMFILLDRHGSALVCTFTSAANGCMSCCIHWRGPSILDNRAQGGGTGADGVDIDTFFGISFVSFL